MQYQRTADTRVAKLGLTALIAVFAALVTLMASGSHAHAASSPVLTPKAATFHDQMRKLWEDHITWTRLAIVDLEAKAPETQQTVNRLLTNQRDIGNAIKPFYGNTAGNRLTTLLKQHITQAAAIIGDAMAGDQEQLQSDTTAWYANADAISRFLATANPRFWPFKAVDSMMHEHLKLTTNEAVDHLKGNYQADIADYDAVHREILMMADALSGGIIGQFPARFR
jgi:hypothetical protein